MLPKDALARLNAVEGDTLVLTGTTDGGVRVTPDKNNFADQMAVAETVIRRYRNTLRELAK